MNKRYFQGVLILGLSLLFGCLPHPPRAHIKNGNVYCRAKGNFTYQWYDYYERGLSCMEGAFYQQAISDLNESLRLRHEDQRKDEAMTLTYGRHLMNYFPHREKGIIHFLTGSYDAAKSELERSVKEYPSQKACHYLDEVRKRIMEQKKVPVSAPRVVIRTPSDGIWTAKQTVTVSGIAEDRQYVSEIDINQDPVFMEASVRRIEFQKAFNLNPGRNRIEITARNLLNGERKVQIIIHVDRSGPVITLETFDPDSGLLKGYLYDDSGEISLFVNGEKEMVQKGKEAPFSIPVEPNIRRITLLASDKLKNQTEAHINPEILTSSYSETLLPPLFATQELSESVTDTGSPLLMLSNSENSKDMTPEIILHGPSDEQPLYAELASVKGEVRGKTDIKKAVINGTLLNTKTGRIIFFNHSVRLEKIGKNEIEIRAEDNLGNKAVKKIIITREIPEPLKLKYRCMFKISPFEMNAGEVEERVFLQYLFLKSLSAENRFRIIMQDELEKIMRKQKLSLSKITTCVSEQKASGPTPFLISGYIHKTKQGIEITAKVNDIRTTEIIDSFQASDTFSASTSVTNRLAERFHVAFPLVAGKVAKNRGENFFASMGKENIRWEWSFVVGSDAEFTGYARIDKEIEHGNYQFQLINKKTDKSLIGDWVVTQ